MTITDLQQKHEFVTLSEQQKAFVMAYCTNGADKIGAANAAYTCKDQKVALAVANRAVRHPNIKKLVSEFFELPMESGNKEEALALVWKKIQGCSDDKLFLGLMGLYGKWKGFDVAKPETPPEDPQDGFSIDDLVREMESKKG